MNFLEILSLVLLTLIILYIIIKIVIKKILDGMIESREVEYEILSKDAEEGRILFLGDSITEMFKVNDYFAKTPVYNRGISGDTTDGVLERLDTNVFPLKPRKIFMLIGTNDFGKKKSVEYVYNNIILITERLKIALPSCEVYVESVFPVREKQAGRRKNKDITALNDKLENSNNKNFVYIDINPHLKDNKGKLKKELTIDGLHLKMGGYLIVRDIIKKYI